MTSSMTSSTDFRVTLLGTGVPTPRPDRFGPSTLVQAGDRLVSGFEYEVEQLVGTRGVPDAHRRALERAEQCGGGQVAVDDSTRPLRTA